MVRSNLKKSWDFYQGTSVGAGSPKALWLGGGGGGEGPGKTGTHSGTLLRKAS